jgi:site-specific recombinase XerD
MNTQATQYLKTLDRSPRTIQTYTWALSFYFNVAGDILSDAAYEKFLLAISKMKPSTKRVMRSAVMRMYEFCEVGDSSKRSRLNGHYMQKIKTKPVTFDRDGVEKIITYCESLDSGLIELRDKAFVITLADSGFRISELCDLKRGDIDWRDERVMVTGKGDKTAIVRLSKRSLSSLKSYLTARAAIDGGSGKALGTLPLFIQHGNVSTIKQMTHDGMRKSVKARMREAGANVRIHDFRHYFVTMVMLASNGNLKMAQELARHESTVTTQRYAHFANSELDKNYDSIFNKAAS